MSEWCVTCDGVVTWPECIPVYRPMIAGIDSTVPPDRELEEAVVNRRWIRITRLSGHKQSNVQLLVSVDAQSSHLGLKLRLQGIFMITNVGTQKFQFLSSNGMHHEYKSCRVRIFVQPLFCVLSAETSFNPTQFSCLLICLNKVINKKTQPLFCGFCYWILLYLSLFFQYCH